MKRFLQLSLVLLVAIGLVACTEEPDREITFNVDAGFTITQEIGADSVDLSTITATDADGMNLSPFLIVEGEYDLDTAGMYPITVSVTDNFGTSASINGLLEIVEATCAEDPTQDKCIIAVNAIAFTSDSLAIDSVYVDEFIRLKWTITPDDAANQDITITSSDDTIASVSEFGYVFGHQLGTVTITITTIDGGYTLTKQITVIEKSCDIDPFQDKCAADILLDDSRVVTLPVANQSGTDYAAMYPNNRLYYEIFVRKFADSDGNNRGDIQGIIDNLPYLQTLHVGGIWLMPIHETSSEHGYDVNDYYSINPQYGTMADFEALVAAADAADIDIIIDLVVNHMGAHNAIFQDVLRNGTSSQYYDWFTWIDTDDPRADDTGSWGQTIWYNPTGRSWLKDGFYTIDASLSDKMYFGYFSDWMPDLNLENPEVVQYIYDVAEFWLVDVGVQGFRMDATSHFYALHEHPSILDRHQANVDFLTDFYNHMQSVKPDSFAVVEAWESYQTYTEFFAAGVSAFNFQASYWIKDAANNVLWTDLGSALDVVYDAIAQHRTDFLDTVFLSNHDMDRIAKVVNDPEEIRLAGEILLTIQGVPFIYFGDELGMLGTRTNMIWGDYYDSMFVEFDDRNVDTVSEQFADDDSLLQHYIELGEVRYDSLALRYGDFVPYQNDYLDGYYRVFDQNGDQELVVVLFNFSNTRYVPIPDEFTSYEILYSSYDGNFGGLSPEGAIILRLPYALYDDLIN